MTHIIDTASKRSLMAKLAAGFAIGAVLSLGTFAEPANARPYHHYYNGGYYRAPPIVYGSRYRGGYYGSTYYGGSPYYYAPPLIYGPGIGINLPGLSIGIR